jgi:hypothetical protein
MKISFALRTMGVGLLTVALSPAWTPLLHGDTWNKETKVTFTETVQLPGTILPAGTYVFRLMDSSSNRNIVQVFDENRQKLITTVLAAPNYRLEPTGKTVMRFDERPVGTPEAIKAWFYPGDNFGQEFIYKKGESLQTAALIAPATPDTPVEVVAQNSIPTEERQPVTSDQAAPPVDTEPVMAAPTDAENPNDVDQPEQDPITPAPAATAPETTKPATSDSTDKLPKTASEMPLIGLLGLACLGSGLAIRNHRRRTV